MPNNTKDKIRLDPYYVAFIDILGATDFIESDKSEEYLYKFKDLYKSTFKTIEKNCSHIVQINNQVKIKIFSDNILIAIQKDYFDTSINDLKASYLVTFVSFFQQLALKHSMLVRGAITIDELYIDENFVYGKALTQAYKLEQNIAIYPRIVINPRDICSFGKDSLSKSIIAKDMANIYYINPFEGFRQYAPQELFELYLDNISSKLAGLLTPKNTDKISQKIFWFISLFNNFCNNYNYSKYSINIEKYLYTIKTKKVIYTGGARELENAN